VRGVDVEIGPDPLQPGQLTPTATPGKRQ
jgi:hypothetical protein